MARLAFPNVAHPVLIDVFRPFGDDQPFATLGAFDDRSVVRTKMHKHSIAEKKHNTGIIVDVGDLKCACLDF
jgi:hypothetical protein